MPKVTSILQDLAKYTVNIPQRALETYGDVVYLIDVSWLLGNSLIGSITNKLITTTIEVVRNVVADLVSVVGSNISGAESLISIVSNLIRNQSFFGDETWIYKFRINPNSVDINRRKLQTITNYGWGQFDVEYFGDELVPINVQGTTGLLMPPYPLPSMGISDVRLTPAYIKLAHLDKFFRKSQQKLLFTVYGKAFYGFLNDLSYRLDANNPRQIKYTMNFTASPTFTFDIFAGDFSELSLDSNMLWEQNFRPTALQGVSDYIALLIQYTTSFPEII